MTNKSKTLSTTAAVIECILFLENRTLSVGEIARLSHISEDRVIASLDEIKVALDEVNHGIVLEKSEEGYQFVPRTTLYERLKRTYGKKVDTRLSRAAIETLTIIAYNQPVKRREIDNIRGTNSEDIVKRLRELEYIKIIDKTDEPGHPARYGTTRKFLYDFNLNSIADLPRLDEEDSQRFEEYDEDGNVLTGAEIKRRMKEGDKKVSSENNSQTDDEIIVIDETTENGEQKENIGNNEESKTLSEPILVKHQKNYSGISDDENQESDETETDNQEQKSTSDDNQRDDNIDDNPDDEFSDSFEGEFDSVTEKETESDNDDDLEDR